MTEESASAADHLGTTRRGIGPCYRDKVGRVHGSGSATSTTPSGSATHLDRIIAYKNRLLTAMLPDFTPFDPKAVADEYLGYAERLRPFVRDTTTWLHQAVADGQEVAVRRGAGVAARRRPRQLPVCDQFEQQFGGDRGGLGGADPAHRPLDRDRQGVHDPGRRRPVPDRAGQRRPASASARSAASTGPSPAARGVAAGSTRSPPGTRPGSAGRPRSP